MQRTISHEQIDTSEKAAPTLLQHVFGPNPHSVPRVGASNLKWAWKVTLLCTNPLPFHLPR